MMNDLNTLVQFLSAIYLTITIDNLMFNRFWTADLYAMTEKALCKFDFCLSSPKKDALLSVIKSVSVTTDKIARRRGGYFLMVCLSLLVFFAFENSLIYELKVITHFVFTLTLFFVCIEYILGIFHWKCWRHVFSYYCVLLVIFIGGTTLLMHVLPLSSFVDYLKNNDTTIVLIGKSLTVFSLVIPIALRLYNNWLNSFVYVRFINSRLEDENQAYQITKEAIKTKDQSKCDPRYDDVYKSVYFSGKGANDSMETGLVDKLVDHLEIICRPQNIWGLIKFRLSKEFNDSIEPQAKQSVNASYALPVSETDENIDYTQCLEEYTKLSGKKIKDFCKEKGINEDAFRKFRKSHL